jgi:choline-glycine betaine transporter
MSDVNKKKSIRKEIFVPSFIIIGGAALLGIFNNALLTKIASSVFDWSLTNLGWLYQLISVMAILIVGVITFSKFGSIRIGGKDAKPKFSFYSWFAMALTGVIATGIITYGVNEPIIYLGNIYNETANLGLKPNDPELVWFTIGRCFYNWTFFPYAMYCISGILAAYLYFNKKKPLTVTATLEPLFGGKVHSFTWLVDNLSLLAIVLGLASSLGAGLALIGSGVETAWGIKQSPMVWFVIASITTALFTVASYLGIDKGIKKLADFNSKIFFILLFLLIIIGPTLYILRTSVVSIGYWLQHFWIWAFDPGDVGGDALVKWWTLYDWAIWIAYAPLMGLFLAMISYGRTIREFMIVNWILPCVFGLVWFGVWGSTAISWQLAGKVDIIAAIKASGAVAGLWVFLEAMPLGNLLVPVVMVTLMLSFATAADVMTTTIASICTKDLAHGEEPPAWQKILWGVSIGAIAFFMVAFAGGEQGVDGVKFLAAAGGAMVLFIFVLQVISAFKVFFCDKAAD